MCIVILIIVNCVLVLGGIGVLKLAVNLMTDEPNIFQKKKQATQLQSYKNVQVPDKYKNCWSCKYCKTEADYYGGADICTKHEFEVFNADREYCIDFTPTLYCYKKYEEDIKRETILITRKDGE